MNETPTLPGGRRPGRARLLLGTSVATALAAVFALVMAILPVPLEYTNPVPGLRFPDWAMQLPDIRW
jgi:hypothetical protein